MKSIAITQIAMFAALVLGLGYSLRAEDEDPKARLQEMKRQAAEYKLTLTVEPPIELKLHEEALMRFDNPVGGVPDGIIAMWKDGERPAVLAQVFLTRDGLWIHECQSFARAGLTMARGEVVKWEPAKAAGEFRSLPSAPKAEKTAARRMVQMKRMAAEFKATDEFKIHPSDTEATHNELRLLPTPLYRYADSTQEIEDGVVFAFVHGTDPELFLILEHWTGKDSGWHYVLAPMTCWAVAAQHDGKQVYTAPERIKSKPNEDYHVWIHKP